MTANGRLLTSPYGNAMKYLIFIVIMLISIYSSAQALFAEANFADSQFSALVNKVDLKEAKEQPFYTGFKLYSAKLEIVDVYYGNLKPGSMIDMNLYVSYLGLKNTLEAMAGNYILSFCQSKSGIFYTNRDFLIINANPVNIAEFERLRKEGSNFDGNHDCASTNYHALNPDNNHDQE